MEDHRNGKPCANCLTTRTEKRVRGFCPKCYPLILKRDWISKWDLHDPSTLRYYPNFEGIRTARYFQVIRKGYLRQVSDDLIFLREREKQRKGGADGMTIENMLVNLARRAGARKRVHYGIAGLIDHTFPPKYKTELFKLLHDIEEAIPNSGFSLSQALEGYDKAGS